jgi:hypothetical protein
MYLGAGKAEQTNPKAKKFAFSWFHSARFSLNLTPPPAATEIYIPKQIPCNPYHDRSEQNAVLPSYEFSFE